MKVGLQLFTLIDIMKTEGGLKKALRHASDAGYDGVEFAGFYGLSTDEIVDELKENGLVTAGIHLGWDNMSWDNLEKNPDDVKHRPDSLYICPKDYSPTLQIIAIGHRSDYPFLFLEVPSGCLANPETRGRFNARTMR